MHQKVVVVIDKDLAFLELYGQLINSLDGLDLLRSYETVQDALERINLDKPDLIIIGFDAGTDEILKSIPKLCKESHIDVILVTDFLESNFLSTAVSYGVSGYLLRSSPLAEMLEAIEVVSEGGGFLNNKIARQLVLSYRRNIMSPLTIRETEVIKLLAIGMTYSMIAKEMSIASGTAKIHIKNIYGKLHVSTKAAAISKAKEIQLL